MSPAAGQCWTYRAPAGFEASRLIVGAVVTFAGADPIVCCRVTGAPMRRPDGGVDTITIPFLPLTVQAFEASVVDADGSGSIDATFSASLADWQSDPRGLSAFSVPFEGFLDVMIARQMEAIIGQSAA